ncbi:hypothetical protein [Natronosalvus amylolyticus]|uniref:hypothetical protein n=1 Tax=Natronosalvus amylolyticus TaxID=2961994 RepID=UPI0020C9B16F|nr:hypothetical protein [Natronosalvus amylolyticus]
MKNPAPFIVAPPQSGQSVSADVVDLECAPGTRVGFPEVEDFVAVGSDAVMPRVTT